MAQPNYESFKPVAGDATFWSPKVIGETINGTLVAVQFLFNKGYAGAPGKMKNRYSILTDDGKTLMTNASGLDWQLETVSLGQYVRIVHEGIKQAKNGVQFRSYKVLSLPGAVNEEWLAVNGKNTKLLDSRLRNSQQEENDEEQDAIEAIANSGMSVAAPKADPGQAFVDDLNKSAADADAKKKRIIDLGIIKFGAKSADEATVKVVMATGIAFSEANYDAILAKIQ